MRKLKDVFRHTTGIRYRIRQLKLLLLQNVYTDVDERTHKKWGYELTQLELSVHKDLK